MALLRFRQQLSTLLRQLRHHDHRDGGGVQDVANRVSQEWRSISEIVCGHNECAPIGSSKSMTWGGCDGDALSGRRRHQRSEGTAPTAKKPEQNLPEAPVHYLVCGSETIQPPWRTARPHFDGSD